MIDRLCYFLARRLPARCWAGNRIGVRAWAWARKLEWDDVVREKGWPR